MISIEINIQPTEAQTEKVIEMTSDTILIVNCPGVWSWQGDGGEHVIGQWSIIHQWSGDQVPGSIQQCGDICPAWPESSQHQQSSTRSAALLTPFPVHDVLYLVNMILHEIIIQLY